MSAAFSAQRRREGIALVLVLIMLVLVSILIVGFFARAGSERTAASAYHGSGSAAMLANSAVNLVQTQINEAISTTGGRTGSVWCSQPGAVRVYDQSKQLKKIYRLYSASSLTAASADELTANDLPLAADWKSAPSLWTDLNEPVAVFGWKDAAGNSLDHGGQGYRVYPILDARDPASDLTDPQKTRFLDAATDEWGENWGFTIHTDSASNPVGTSAAAPCLPVRWIYVLQDGSFAAPVAGASAKSPVTIPGAAAQNPIVGRIAFWTDDETCKVNVNTAGGSRGMRPYLADGTGRVLPLPAPWDTPRFKGFDERMLFSENQPVHGEYQRYPGHPATTDLYNIWQALGMAGQDYPLAAIAYTDPVSAQSTPIPSPSSYFARLPRYSDDHSSQGGVRNTTAAAIPTPGPVNNGVPKTDRFYTALGEMLYQPGHNPSGVSRQQAESGKFFLTTHSRAPDETFNGTPRVAMWPVNADPTKRTDYDQRLAFCTTLGSGTAAAPFYVQRSSSNDPDNDWTHLTRNQQLYQYLQNLTGSDVPGFGGSLSGKYGIERDQILTEMLDYIRSTNLSDHSNIDTPANRAAYSFTNGNLGQVVPLRIGQTRGLGRVTTLSEIGLLLICTADGNSTLAYQVPANKTYSGKSELVSPVTGSANDAAYVSNLPVAQYLRDTSGTVVGKDGAPPTAPFTNIFPSNKTLANDYSASDPGDAQRLGHGQKRLQAMLLLETACPMMGYDPMSGASYQFSVSGLHGVTIAGLNPFPDRTTTSTAPASKLNGDGVVRGPSAVLGSIQNYGGITGFRFPLVSYSATVSGTVTNQSNQVYNAWSGYNPYGASMYPYRYISNPFTVTVPSGGTMGLSGGCTIQLQVPGNPVVTYQTFNVDFPALSNLPAPDLPKNGLGYQHGTRPGYTSNAADWWSFDNRIAWTVYPHIKPATDSSTIDISAFQPYLDEKTTKPYLGMGCVIRADNPPPATWTYQSTDTTPTYVPTLGSTVPSDVVRTLVAKDGDYRLTAALDTVDAKGLLPDASGQGGSQFAKGPGYDDGGKLADLFMDQGASGGTAGVDPNGTLVANTNYAPGLAPKVPGTLDAAKQLSWDWDSGLPYEADGAYANKPDEGNTNVKAVYDPSGQASPYYWQPSPTSQTPAGYGLNYYFTANRILPSPVMFGSLPTGVLTGNTWRTLLFRPQANRPAYADPPPGPPDHLWLDLFTMPVVEPYAISEPFSTAGKINLNYQIEPFTFITRDTGVRAVLASELIAQVPKSAAGVGTDGASLYKGSPATAKLPPNTPAPQRLPIFCDETTGTLAQFEKRFQDKDLFRSASEICSLYLVPRGYTLPGFMGAWYGNDFTLVGDNVRERPYGDIYPRLTVRSNTFTVHYRVQALKSPDAISTNPTKAGQWDEQRGTITGEARGSTTIERYLNPGRQDLPDYTVNPLDQPPLDQFYEWRVVASSRFPP